MRSPAGWEDDGPIGHRSYEGLALWRPATPDDVRDLLEPIPLPPRPRVLDVGGGRAAVLVRLAAYARWVRRGGHVVTDDGFWASPPPAAHLEPGSPPTRCALARRGATRSGGTA